ncbi:MAG TPA: ABC transporter ATP-binding protein [Candidatus Binatia bacterium]|jgi:ABC-type Fe3+/spermidine/putrescine transport system ATPase subunit|nr:ABC transporter ATP-binding protein [Candidatus Binatia bacterium]
MKTSAEVLLRVERLYRRYGSAVAVDEVSFEVFQGEFFSLLGPSGCGKSTTLRLLAGLEEPDSGEICLKGDVIVSARDGIFVSAEQRHIGLVFQSYAVWPHMTAFQNVAYPLEVRRWNRQETRRKAEQVLESVGLAGLEDRRPAELSGGQQQRLALARSLVYEPDLLLLDEPLSNVDAKLREQLRIELKKLQQKIGITIVYVTHDQSEAMALSHRLAVMNRGRIEQIGRPEEVYKAPGTFFVQNFVGRLITFEGRLTERSSQRVVELPGGRSIAIRDGLAIANGGQVCVAVRPEDMEIEAGAGEPGAQGISGTVQDVAYVGGRYECAIQAAGSEFVLDMPASLRLAKGQAVTLRLKETTVWPSS